jgi:hypothetical protein
MARDFFWGEPSKDATGRISWYSLSLLQNYPHSWFAHHERNFNMVQLQKDVCPEQGIEGRKRLLQEALLTTCSMDVPDRKGTRKS